MDLPALLSCSIPLPIRPSLWWWSITWHEEEKQGGEKGPPFILRWWRSTSFFFKWLPSCDAAFKTYGPNFLPLNSLPGSSCYTECEAFSSRDKKSLWKVCWLSHEYFIISHVLNVLCKIHNLTLQYLSYFAIRPTYIVQICESTLNVILQSDKLFVTFKMCE